MSREEKLELVARMRRCIQEADRRGEAIGFEKAVEIMALSLAVIADSIVDDEVSVLVRRNEE